MWLRKLVHFCRFMHCDPIQKEDTGFFLKLESTNSTALQKMSEFENIFAGLALKSNALPLLHTCDVYQFREIAKTSILPKTPCDVFVGEDLVYCFYGKPSFRLKADGSYSSIAHFPVVFIFNGEKLPAPKRVYPFDSGAFSQLPSVRQKYFHDKINRDDFLLSNALESAKGVVEYFYGNNEQYCFMKPARRPDDIAVTNFEARQYCAMISDSSHSQFDDRLASIEFIFGNDISITHDTLRTVILPGSFYHDPKIKKKIDEDWEVIPETYYTVRGNPNEYIGLVINLTIQYLKREKLI